jgi:hypothetical protein
MRLSAHRIRSINRSIARANGIIYGASDKTHRAVPENQKPVPSVSLGSVVRIVSVPKAATP